MAKLKLLPDDKIKVKSAKAESTEQLFKRIGINHTNTTPDGTKVHEGTISHEHYATLHKHLTANGYHNYKNSNKAGHSTVYHHDNIEHQVKATPDLSSYSIGKNPNWKIRSVTMPKSKSTLLTEKDVRRTARKSLKEARKSNPNVTYEQLLHAKAPKPETTDAIFKRVGIKKVVHPSLIKHEGVITPDHYQQLSKHLVNKGYRQHTLPYNGYKPPETHFTLEHKNGQFHSIQVTPNRDRDALYPKSWNIKSLNNGVNTKASLTFDAKSGLWINDMIVSSDATPLVNRLRIWSATNKEEPRLSSKDHERVIQEAHDRHRAYSKAYQAHRDQIAPEIKKIAEKRGITQSQAAKFHHGYPALKTLNHLRANSQVEHENAQKAYDDYKARKLLPKKKD